MQPITRTTVWSVLHCQRRHAELLERSHVVVAELDALAEQAGLAGAATTQRCDELQRAVDQLDHLHTLVEHCLFNLRNGMAVPLPPAAPAPKPEPLPHIPALQAYAGTAQHRNRRPGALPLLPAPADAGDQARPRAADRTAEPQPANSPAGHATPAIHTPRKRPPINQDGTPRAKPGPKPKPRPQPAPRKPPLWERDAAAFGELCSQGRTRHLERVQAYAAAHGLITLAQAAERTGFALTTYTNYRSRGLLPAHAQIHGGIPLWREADLAAFPTKSQAGRPRVYADGRWQGTAPAPAP